MTVRERILSIKVMNLAEKNPKLSEELGITAELKKRSETDTSPQNNSFPQRM